MSPRHIFYEGNGTVSDGSGLPDAGRFFVVGDNRALAPAVPLVRAGPEEDINRQPH